MAIVIDGKEYDERQDSVTIENMLSSQDKQSEKDLESTGINLNLRPDELNTATFIKLSKLIKNNG